MKNRLVIYSLFVLAAMLAVTGWASLEKGVGEGFRYLFAERWGIATLFDAYFGFAFFWIWVVSKERSSVKSAGWAIAILLFGNIAMAIYVLREALRLKPGEGIETFLLPRKTL